MDKELEIYSQILTGKKKKKWAVPSFSDWEICKTGETYCWVTCRKCWVFKCLQGISMKIQMWIYVIWIFDFSSKQCQWLQIWDVLLWIIPENQIVVFLTLLRALLMNTFNLKLLANAEEHLALFFSKYFSAIRSDPSPLSLCKSVFLQQYQSPRQGNR